MKARDRSLLFCMAHDLNRNLYSLYFCEQARWVKTVKVSCWVAKPGRDQTVGSELCSGSLSTGSPVGSLERKSQQHFLPKLIIKGIGPLIVRTFAIYPTLNEHSKV